MVDLTKLSQEQKWGLSYATKLANDATIASNLGKPSGEQKPLLTEQQYADSVFRGACDSYYASLLDFKKKNALQLFDALSPQQQAALVAQLQIPDVLPSAQK
jgi:hypothetical protein